MLILASRSPRRQALLRAAGIAFRVSVPEAEESDTSRVRGSYAARARRAALAKAESVARRKEGLVLGADTIVVCDGEVMGKPGSRADARRMLARLSGRWHRVYTGVALVGGGRRLVDYECTEVAFRELSKGQIDRYVGTGEPMDKAGAYAIQGEGAALVRALRGCYTNVIGLPVPKVLEMLRNVEKGLSQSRAGREDRA
jgi:septum formation protein